LARAGLDVIEVEFSDSGGSGPAVVLSHGFLMDRTMFDAQVEALAREFRVVTWDQRGFGGTRAPGPFSYWDSAQDLLGLMDYLGLEHAIVGGMSQGGFVSLRAALLAAARVDALVLLDTQSGCEDPALVPSYDLMLDTWREQGPGPVQEIVASIILGPGDWTVWFAKWAALEPEQMTLAYRCLMDRDDITDQLAEISCPALVLHGLDDAAIPVGKAEELCAGLAGEVTFVTVAGGPHASNITHAAQVNEALLEFLRAVSPA
jgi:3-oxoadipate enol-lactonase